MKQLVLNSISNINNIKDISSIANNIKGLGAGAVSCAVLESPKEWVGNSIKDFIVNEKEQIVNWICNGIVGMCDIGCVVCIIVCGMAILWFIIDQKGSTPRKYISGSFIFYMGMRLIQYVIG